MSRRFLWLLPVGMSAVVFGPIIRNYFSSDDFFNLWYLANEGVGRFILLPHGGHSCVTRNLAIALLHALFGMNPAPYLALALLTHLLNVCLLFEVVHRLTASRRAACVAAALWGMAPVQEGTLGWFAVYGQVLAATCALWVLAGLSRWRAGQPARPATRWLWGGAMIVGALSFGIGIGVALVMPPIAWLLLPPGHERTRTVALLSVSAAAAVALYFGQGPLFEMLYAELPPSVPTEFLMHQWLLKASFLAELAGYGVVALLLGPLDRPTDYPGPVGAAILGVATLLAGLAVRRAPAQTLRPLLACALLAVGIYGLITAGRGQFAAMPGMVRTLRYQYAGSIAAAVAIGIVAGALAARWRMPEWVNDAALASWAAAAVALTWRLGPPINHFDAARKEAAAVLGSIDAIVSAAPPGSDVYVRNRPFVSVGMMYGANLAAFPGWAAIFAIVHPDDVVDGHRVHFVIEDAGTLARAQHGRRAPALLCDRPSTTPDAGAPSDR